ncbi:MAG: DUF2298 domain-containing protein [Candidatus Shapirobacteria bacterium]|jgi:uncharacterized membrane protein
MVADFKYIVFWWLTIFLIGSLSLPLIFTVFRDFYDKGYIFSKIAGIAILTYIIFVLGIFKFLPFSSSSIFFILFFVLLANILYLSKKDNFAKFKKDLLLHHRQIISQELAFFGVLTLWSFIRGHSPDIDNLEKFMDWGFVNSVLRSTFMPPADMWYSGEPINYYYFGHLIFGVLTKISGIDSAITYNLSIATVCALTFVSGFSITSNLVVHFNVFKAVIKKKLDVRNIRLKQAVLAGVFSAFLLTFGGNFHAVYKIIKLDISQNNGRFVLTKDALNQAANSYWYPDATRFIGFDPDIKDKTIHEFPLYSFVVADLHGHMNDIPVILFFIAFLFAFSLSPVKAPSWKLIVPSGLILSIAFMTNAWDFFVYGLTFAVCLFFIHLHHTDFYQAIRSILINGFLTVLCWYLFTLPFTLNFIPMADGVRLVDYRTPFYQLFVLYGGFWLICLPLLGYFFYRFLKDRSFIKKMIPSDVIALALILVATLLVLLPEIIYLKDIYIYEHRRANTMFKLVYQAFILYSLVAGYAVYRLSASIRPRMIKFLYKVIVLIVFTSHLIYPFFAIKSAYGSLSSYKGLYGLGFLKTAHPDSFEAVKWINANISGQPVILEAAGDSYTYYNHISAATGVPTVLGWLVHEWLWHGGQKDPNSSKYLNKLDCGDPCSVRGPDVQRIYESQDVVEVRSLLQKYNVDYVFVGDKELEKYQSLNVDVISGLSQIVFESGKTKLYKITK